MTHGKNPSKTTCRDTDGGMGRELGMLETISERFFDESGETPLAQVQVTSLKTTKIINATMIDNPRIIRILTAPSDGGLPRTAS